MVQRARRLAFQGRPRRAARMPSPRGGAGGAGGSGGLAAAPSGGGTRVAPPPSPDAARIIEILSHELRSPITTIHLGARVLRDEEHAISGPVRNEVVAAVDEEAERLYRLVEDLLAIARHEDGRVSLPMRPLLLQHWLPAVVDAEAHADRRLVARVTLRPDLPPVLADDGALAHVLRNVLGNATRHAPRGMPVQVLARRPASGMVQLELLDRGPGFDIGEAERLFEPFYRSPAAVASGSGAGLGLTAARRLARAMGGDVQARRRPGGGARILVRLVVAGLEDDDEGDDEGDESGA